MHLMQIYTCTATLPKLKNYIYIYCTFIAGFTFKLDS